MNQTIRTKDGKVIQVSRAWIKVSANKHSDCGWFSDTVIHAVLPGGRKTHILSKSPSHNAINLNPLFAYIRAGYIKVDPEAYRAFLQSLPVLSDSLHGFGVEITAEVERAARAKEESICDCPAVKETFAQGVCDAR